MKHIQYIRYHVANALKYEIDTHLDAAVWLADFMRLDSEQRYWLSFLTALCETTPTSYYMLKHFPTFKETKPKAFADFCNNNRGAMAFQYDVRWILYDIEKVIQSYRDYVGERTQEEAIKSVAIGNTPEERWLKLTKGAKLHKFGNYVFMLYTELLYYLCGVDTAAVVDPKENHSVRSGLISALGLNDVILCTEKGTRPTVAENNQLKIGLEEIVTEIRSLNIRERHKTMWAIETTLCTFNKTLHGRRYLGFYKNRQAKEIKRLSSYTASIGEKFDWTPLINYHNNWGKW